MSSYKLRFRQVHLDFHTSPDIPGIGASFDKAKWQEALKVGHVDSITCFSKCHHGWSYHPTTVGQMHPHLDFDLLRAQMDACREIDVNVPVYVSAGADDLVWRENPQWRELSIEGCYQGWGSPMNKPGFAKMCFDTPYLDYLCDQIREAVRLFPEANGIFLDIIYQGECCCKWCLPQMMEQGFDPDSSTDRQAFARQVLLKYYRETTAACRADDPSMPVFHNSGHITKGDRDILQYFSHLELESLPTGGWGYDHFPLSTRYVQKLGLDYLGMTGKFHTTWGEFGGYKHPNALRYECAAMIANGAKCSVGDQLHPSSEIDSSTYAIIGAAYAEVEEKEPWCDDVTPVADIAVLSSESVSGNRVPDTGAGRVLLEEHLLFDLVDRSMDLSGYRLLILPDEIILDDDLTAKVNSYLGDGGRVLATGRSGVAADASRFAIDIGAEYAGESPWQPDYLVAGDRLRPDFADSPLVMYVRSQQAKTTTGETLAQIRLPYFNRTWKHFCSHQHAPAADVSEYAGAVRKGDVLYLSHPVFMLYYAQGAVAYRQYAARAIRLMLGDDETLRSNLPSTARVTLMDQAAQSRWVLHLLHANVVARGADVQLSPEGYVRASTSPEVIEDLLPLHGVALSLKLPRAVTRATLVPQGQEIPVESKNGRLTLTLDEFVCHQMVALQYE